jgi:uncharacterized Tic20 family protein
VHPLHQVTAHGAVARIQEADKEKREMSSPNSETPEAGTGPVPQTEDKEEKMWATLCHLSAFAFFLLWGVGHVVGPYSIWLLKREDFPFVREQGKEVLNFQFSATIYGAVALALVPVYAGAPLFLAVVIFAVVTTMIGASRASAGIAYRYPLCIRFLK